MTANNNNNYLDCLRASVGLTGYDEEELSIWYQCPGTKLEEGCFCTDLEDEVLLDCGDPEWIAKFCKPILDALTTTTTTPAPEPVQDEDNSTVVSFFVFLFHFFLFGAILGAKKIKHEIMSAFNFFWAITHKLAIKQFSKKTNYKLF